MKARYKIVIRQVQGRRITLSKNSLPIKGFLSLLPLVNTAINDAKFPIQNSQNMRLN
jgi:hypothetical protein